MKELPINYAVHCETAEETNKVLNYHNSEYSGFSHWKYVTFNSSIPVSGNNLNIFTQEYSVKDYEIITFKEWEDMINQKEFQLPENWFLKVTEESLPFINQVRNKQTDCYDDVTLNKPHYNYYPCVFNYGGLICGGNDGIMEKNIEINLETFKHFYIDNKMKKEIKLTREQLVTLYESDSCSDWKAEIKKILSSDVLLNEFVIPQSSIDYLVKDGSNSQKKLVTDLGVDLDKSLQELYLEGQANCGLKIGDSVRVTRIAEDKENGWTTCWCKEMSSSVGKSFKIEIIDESTKTDGFRLDNDFWYPYFILEKVVDEYIHFTFEDDLLGKQVIAKDKSCKGIITYQGQNDMLVGEFTKTYKYLFDEYTFLDGTPCGKLKQ